MKYLVEQFDIIAKEYLDMIQHPSNIAEMESWFEIHGWNNSDEEHYLLVARQAILNAVIRQIFSDLTFQKTPFDSVKVPISLIDRIQEMKKSSLSFNFWGEIYNILIPQSQRRLIGQFWTDELIADWMVSWLLGFQPNLLVDVGYGSGNFLIKAGQHIRDKRLYTQLYGFDISPLLLNITQANFSDYNLISPKLAIQDYLVSSIPIDAEAVICNPPYTRHHYINPTTKDKLQWFFRDKLNLSVSRKSSMAFYFLIKLIAEMNEDAHCAVIVPMEVLDAHYGIKAKQVLYHQTAIKAIINFSQQMNAFQNVDVGASILLFKKGYEKDNLVHNVTLDSIPNTDELLMCLNSYQDQNLSFGSHTIKPQNELLEIPKWFGITNSKPVNKEWEENGLVVPLKSLAKVVRGIATGANNFFALTSEEVKKRNLEPCVVKTIQRNREIQDIILDEETWQKLSDEGKRVWLLYLNGKDKEIKLNVLDYISQGETENYHLRSLVQTRKKWYFMEQREIPSIFFTILTRGNPRFILNKAGVRPLNMFLLIYPNTAIIQSGCIEILWVLLNCTFSISRLHSVSRTYGGNTLKVEPRELDNLPVINPLSLPREYRQKIKKMIDNFYYHRKANILIEEVNKLVENFLNSEIIVEYSLPTPVQLQLLDTQIKYD